jgi:hypothetical protein
MGIVASRMEYERFRAWESWRVTSGTAVPAVSKPCCEHWQLSLECCWNVGNAGVCAVAAACTSLEALVLSGCAKLSDVALGSYPPSQAHSARELRHSCTHAFRFGIRCGDYATLVATMQHLLQRSVRCDSLRPVSSTLVTLGPHCFRGRVSLGQHGTLLRKLALNNLVRLTDEGVCSVAEVR